MNVTEYYEQSLAARGYKADSAQRRTIDRMQQFYDDFVFFKKAKQSIISRLLTRPQVPQGLYLWGGVGRGKSFLMDCFYSVVPIQRKIRIHFHEFMRDVHAELNELKGKQDPLDAVAKNIAKKYRLICFDEFHISDIADAMILHRLLTGLFQNGVTFLITSNYAPKDLYPNGLHRDRLLPAIELLCSNLSVLNVDAGIDYRVQTLERLNTFITPIPLETHNQLSQAFDQLAEIEDEEPMMHIETRSFAAVRRAGSIIWFDFRVLCGGPRSQNDYLEIAQQFSTVIVSNVPKMNAGMASEARRFTWLIDVLYDHKVKIIFSSDVPANDLYIEGAMANEFSRTVSRIMEMQTQQYLETPKRDAVRM